MRLRSSDAWHRAKFAVVLKLRDWGRQIDHAEKMRHVRVSGPIEGPGRVVAFMDVDGVDIGSYTSINRDATLLVGERHATGLLTTFPLRRELGLPPGDAPLTRGGGRTVIGSDVWIGYEAVVMSGVTIGHGAVVAARAVVTKDVPPYAVVMGMPALVVRYRYPPETVEQLLRIAWWDWPPETVAERVDLIESSDLAAFLERFGGQT